MAQMEGLKEYGWNDMVDALSRLGHTWECLQSAQVKALVDKHDADHDWDNGIQIDRREGESGEQMAARYLSAAEDLRGLLRGDCASTVEGLLALAPEERQTFAGIRYNLATLCDPTDETFGTLLNALSQAEESIHDDEMISGPGAEGIEAIREDIIGAGLGAYFSVDPTLLIEAMIRPLWERGLISPDDMSILGGIIEEECTAQDGAVHEDCVGEILNDFGITWIENSLPEDLPYSSAQEGGLLPLLQK